MKVQYRALQNDYKGSHEGLAQPMTYASTHMQALQNVAPGMMSSQRRCQKPPPEHGSNPGDSSNQQEGLFQNVLGVVRHESVLLKDGITP